MTCAYFNGIGASHGPHVINSCGLRDKNASNWAKISCVAAGCNVFERNVLGVPRGKTSRGFCLPSIFRPASC